MQALLDAWSRSHALVALVACGAALVTRDAAWFAAGAAVSLAGLVFATRRRWSPSGRFGAASLVTTLRLGVSTTLAFLPTSTSGVWLGALALLVFALDGVDGWLARRFATASEFGAHYDMETDASFVLVAELVLFLRGDVGAWILVTGLLRYVYVLTVALVPPRSEEVRRSRWGRFAFSCLAVGLIGAFVLPPELGTPLAALGTAAVSASFASSFHAVYRRPRRDSLRDERSR